MSEHNLPKINPIHFGGPWIGISVSVGLLIPAVIRIFTGQWLWIFSIVGGTGLLAFLVVFLIEMRQDFSKGF